jgi:hypothetical protein
VAKVKKGEGRANPSPLKFIESGLTACTQLVTPFGFPREYIQRFSFSVRSSPIE